MKNELIIGVLVLACGCCGQKDAANDTTSIPGKPLENEMPGIAETGPPVIVYSTKSDHRNHVPVTLSEDGKTIISYPAPTDLRGASGPPVPTDVGNGYLLDIRGIGPNVAFVEMDYTTYAALEKAPSLDEMMAMIKDKDPLSSMYNCGARTRYADIAAEILIIVSADALGTRCKKLK